MGEEEQTKSGEQATSGSPPHYRYRYRSGMSPRVIVGIVLIFFGFDLLIELATGIDVRTVAAGLGAGFLLYWRGNRGYPWLVAGSILLGVGLGNMLSPLLEPTWRDSLERLFLAGGFALIPIFDKRSRSTWAWIPAGIIALLAVASFAVDVNKLVDPELATPILPALAIIAGSLLLLRDKMPQGAFVPAIALVVAVGVAIASLSGFSLVGNVLRGEPSHSETRRFEIPDLEGRRLLVRTGSGEISIAVGETKGSARLRTSDNSESNAKRRLSKAQVNVEESADLVSVSVSAPHVRADFQITVPLGSDVRLETGSGEIGGRVEGLEEVRIFTGSGDVSVVGYSSELLIRTGSGDVALTEGPNAGSRSEFLEEPDVDVATGSGDVVLDLSQDVALQISTGSGDIQVEGEDESDPDRFTRSGSRGLVSVRTGSGDVNVEESRAR